MRLDAWMPGCLDVGVRGNGEMGEARLTTGVACALVLGVSNGYSDNCSMSLNLDECGMPLVLALVLMAILQLQSS